MVIDVEKIVFFFNEDTENNEKQACVFYTDGSREIVSYEDAKRLAAKTALERKMTSSNLRNNDIIFFERSKKDLKEKHSFVEEETNNIDLNEVFAKREVKSEKKKKKIPFNLRVAAGFVAGVVGLGASVYGLSKIAKSGDVANNIFSSKNSTTTSEEVENDNNFYDSYTYEELLEVTNNEAQKAEMQRVHDALYGYNVDFAENYLEEDKDIRAALSFEEVVAMSEKE